MWSAFVDLIRVTIFSAAHVCGGSLGTGVLVVSLAVRVALLPMTLRLARASAEQQRKLAALKPELDRLQKRLAGDPRRLLQETQALHARHGIRMLSPGGIVGLLVQAPLLGGLFAAVRSGLGAGVRFVWIADLGRPDRLLTILVAAAAAGAAALAPSPSAQASAARAVPLISAAIMLVMFWSTSSAVTLSVGAGSLVSALQNEMLKRRAPR